MNICAASADITLLENTLENSPAITCMDFWLFLINNGDITYNTTSKLLDNIGLFSLEYASGAFSLSGTALTTTTQLPNMYYIILNCYRWNHFSICINSTDTLVHFNTNLILSSAVGTVNPFTKLVITKSSSTNCAYFRQVRIWSVPLLTDITPILINSIFRYEILSSSDSNKVTVIKNFPLTDSDNSSSSNKISDISQKFFTVSSFIQSNTLNTPSYDVYSDISYTDPNNLTTGSKLYLHPPVICPDNSDYLYSANNNYCKSSKSISSNPVYVLKFKSNDKKVFHNLNQVIMSTYWLVQFWINPLYLNNNFDIMGQYPTVDPTRKLKIGNKYTAPDNRITLTRDTVDLISAPFIPKWNHYAFRRADTTLRMYVNNIEVTPALTITTSNPLFINNEPLYIANQTPINIDLFHLSHVIFLNYKISDRYLNYLFKTKPDFLDFNTILYLKLDYYATGNKIEIINYGDITKSSNGDALPFS